MAVDSKTQLSGFITQNVRRTRSRVFRVKRVFKFSFQKNQARVQWLNDKELMTVSVAMVLASTTQVGILVVI